MEDKRRFTRIFFSTPAKLTASHHTVTTSLIDVSLKGALLSVDDSIAVKPGDHYVLTFDLEGSDVTIEMQGHLAHIEPDSLGFACEKIDIESVTHLRRLLELNVGNSDLLDRELSSLSRPESN